MKTAFSNSTAKLNGVQVSKIYGIIGIFVFKRTKLSFPSVCTEPPPRLWKFSTTPNHEESFVVMSCKVDHAGSYHYLLQNSFVLGHHNQFIKFSHELFLLIFFYCFVLFFVKIVSSISICSLIFFL